MSLLDLIVEKRPEILRIAAEHGAHNLRLFGSVARGEDHEGSDVDLLADIHADAPRRAWSTPEWDLAQRLESLLGVHVDVAQTVHPLIRERVLAETVPLDAQDFRERAVIESRRPHVPIDRNRLHLVRILEGCEKVLEYAAAGREQFEASSLYQDAIVHQISNIGEAARSVSPQFRGGHPEVPWKQFMDLRNIAIHHYYDLKLDTIWRETQDDVPTLKAAVQKLI